jgi:hypothetical protein
MFGTMISAERAVVAINRLVAGAGARWQALRSWMRYRPERRYMRGSSAA